ncbi:MAG TPA: type II secretion system minor pseudopilin GspH [Steroidobacteraceae bacterium]|nr:type II secretion system minor pseudopilin GspH [Steroidobacteraceae bacterium]
MLRSRGFTLIEILVVMVIIAVISAGAILSLSSIGRDTQLEDETRRLATLINYAREQAELQTREMGLFCREDGYRFLVFDPRRNLWVDIGNDETLRARTLPAGLNLRLTVEAQEVVLESTANAKTIQPQDLQPHVMIFSNGDLTSFKVAMAREGSDRTITLAPDDQGRVTTDEVKPPAAGSGA